MEDEERLERAQLYESKRLAKALLSYLSRHHDLVGPLFDLLDIFTVRTRVDFAFLKDYLKTTVAQTYSLEEKRQARPSLLSCMLLHLDCILSTWKICKTNKWCWESIREPSQIVNTASFPLEV